MGWHYQPTLGHGAAMADHPAPPVATAPAPGADQHAAFADGLPPITRLRAVMARLRDPDGGCPWDLEQDFASIAPYTIEEAYEVVDAIRRGDTNDLRDELGDLLLQVVFHAQIAGERGLFDFDAVANAIADKMIQRHPHVFGSVAVRNAEAVTTNWEGLKAAERAAKAAANGQAAPVSVLDGIAALPALLHAVKLQKRVARVGFDWGAIGPVLDKITEEIGELRQEIDAATPDAGRLTDELGDVLFACVNLARHLKIDPDRALASTNAKFERRFRGVEARLAARGLTPDQAGLAEMDALWHAIKQEEHQS